MSVGDLAPEDASLPTEGFKLRRGRSRLPRALIVDHQRRRLLTGAAFAVAEHGYARMSVGHVIESASVSRSTFYEHFENKQACVLAAHEDAFDRFLAVLVEACAGQLEWSAKVVAAIEATIEFAVRAPEVSRLLLLETLAGEPELAQRVLSSDEILAGLLRNGREQCPRAVYLPTLTERALIGAATSVIGARLLSGQADRLRDLTPELIHLMLIPYLGSEEAKRVARASAPGSTPD